MNGHAKKLNHEIAYKLGCPSSKKNIKDEECILNDHQCTQNKVAGMITAIAR